MAKRNTTYDKAEVIADWKTGNFSERSLAAKHKISPAMAHKIVAGIDKEIEPLVSAQVAINQKVAKLSEQEVSKFEQEVSKKTEHILFFANAAVENVRQAMDAECSSQGDYKLRADTIAKGREAAVGKEPQVAVQANVSSTMVSGIPDFIREMISPV